MTDNLSDDVLSQLHWNQQLQMQKQHTHHQASASIKRTPADFIVREQLKYELSGEGDYVYLQIQKQGINTQDLAEQLCKWFQLPSDAVKYSGLKDRNAQTTQWFSLQTEGDLIKPETTLANDGWEILDANRHTNPLKSGLLAGNEFELNVTVDEATAGQLQQYDQQRLIVPNFYGMQRFGAEGENAIHGLNLLNDKQSLRKFPRKKWKFFKKLFVSSVQAGLFNLWLNQRLNDSKTLQIVAGDIVQKTTTGGMFTVEPEELEQALERQQQGELVVSGPIFGYRMRQPKAQAQVWEQNILDLYQWTIESFRVLGKVALGTRRPGVIVVDDLSISPIESGVKMKFSLPAGAYATSVLQSLVSEVESEE